MFRRYHTLIAAMSIALQAIDVIVAVVGHHHAGEILALAKSAAAHCERCDQRHACLGHHAHDTHKHGRSLPGQPHPGTDDDCSLCRHASQAVVPAAPPLELGSGQHVEVLVVRHSGRVAIAATISHEARGPPALVV